MLKFGGLCHIPELISWSETIRGLNFNQEFWYCDSGSETLHLSVSANLNIALLFLNQETSKKFVFGEQSLNVGLWHSVRCMHEVIGKFTNLHFGILKKSEVLGPRGLKVCA